MVVHVMRGRGHVRWRSRRTSRDHIGRRRRRWRPERPRSWPWWASEHRWGRSWRGRGAHLHLMMGHRRRRRSVGSAGVVWVLGGVVHVVVCKRRPRRHGPTTTSCIGLMRRHRRRQAARRVQRVMVRVVRRRQALVNLVLVRQLDGLVVVEGVRGDHRATWVRAHGRRVGACVHTLLLAAGARAAATRARTDRRGARRLAAGHGHACLGILLARVLPCGGLLHLRVFFASNRSLQSLSFSLVLNLRPLRQWGMQASGATKRGTEAGCDLRISS